MVNECIPHHTYSSLKNEPPPLSSCKNVLPFTHQSQECTPTFTSHKNIFPFPLLPTHQSQECAQPQTILSFRRWRPKPGNGKTNLCPVWKLEKLAVRRCQPCGICRLEQKLKGFRKKTVIGELFRRAVNSCSHIKRKS